MPYKQSDSPREEMFKKTYPFRKIPLVCPERGRREGRRYLTYGAYASYVSANAAKCGKSVNPKAAKGQPCLAEARERRWRAFDQIQDRRPSTFPSYPIAFRKCPQYVVPIFPLPPVNVVLNTIRYTSNREIFKVWVGSSIFSQVFNK